MKNKVSKCTFYQCAFCGAHYPKEKDAIKCFKSDNSKICVSCFTPMKINDFSGYDNATNFIIDCGYGSSHDLERHKLVLCDKCLDKYLEKVNKK